MTDAERTALLARINGLEDIAAVEDRRYPFGGLGFWQQAAELRRLL